MEKALHESGPLQSEGRNQEVEANAAEAVTLKERHEKAETNEDHHMHVLETCTMWTGDVRMVAYYTIYRELVLM